MKIQPADVLDRFTILTLKRKHAPDDAGVLAEFNAYQDESQSVVRETPSLAEIVVQLLIINEAIWNLESDIRKGRGGELGMEEVGCRALKIRDFNGKRIACKNLITELTQTGFMELKVNHASQK